MPGAIALLARSLFVRDKEKPAPLYSARVAFHAHEPSSIERKSGKRQQHLQNCETVGHRYRKYVRIKFDPLK